MRRGASNRTKRTREITAADQPRGPNGRTRPRATRHPCPSFKPQGALPGAKPASFPGFIEPALATLRAKLPPSAPLVSHPSMMPRDTERRAAI
jgi:hypothetical protein